MPTTPDHDRWPGPPVGQPPATVTTVGRVLARELRYQLVDWRLLADRTSDPELRGALHRNVLAWDGLLEAHLPDDDGRCRRCRRSWGRRSRWPCALFSDVAAALRG